MPPPFFPFSNPVPKVQSTASWCQRWRPKCLGAAVEGRFTRACGGYPKHLGWRLNVEPKSPPARCNVVSPSLPPGSITGGVQPDIDRLYGLPTISRQPCPTDKYVTDQCQAQVMNTRPRVSQQCRRPHTVATVHRRAARASRGDRGTRQNCGCSTFVLICFTGDNSRDRHIKGSL